MALPNIMGASSIYGKTAPLAVTNSAVAIVSGASGKSMKVNALYVSNIHATNAGLITIDLYRSSVAYRIGKAISVPINSTLDVISKTIYLEEGDTLRVTADANTTLEAVASYEEIS
jgi:hypothetical protein